MKNKDLNDLKTKPVGDLKKMIADLEKEKINAAFEIKMGKGKNVHIASSKKKNIAKIKTILNLKILAQSTDIKKEVKNGVN